MKTILLLITFFFISCVNKNKNIEYIDDNANVLMNSEEFYVEHDSILINKIEGAPLNMNTQVTNSKGQILTLNDIVTDQALFIRYSNFACYDCITYILESLCKEDSVIPYILLISDMPQRDMHVYESTNKRCMLYLVDSISIDFDKGLTPFVFRCVDGKVVDFMIPQKENATLFDKYIHKLHKNFQ